MFDHAETQRLLRRQKSKVKAAHKMMKIHLRKVRSKYEDYCADRIISKRLNKITDQAEQLGKEIESRVAQNEKEIGEMLKREAPEHFERLKQSGLFARQ